MLGYVSAWSIVGYCYQADLWCTQCIVPALVARYLSASVGVESIDDTERALAYIAERLGLDICDESSYDSYAFPKVVFADQLTDYQVCANCADPL